MSPEETREAGGRMTLIQIILPYLKIWLVPLSVFLVMKNIVIYNKSK